MNRTPAYIFPKNGKTFEGDILSYKIQRLLKDIAHFQGLLKSHANAALIEKESIIWGRLGKVRWEVQNTCKRQSLSSSPVVLHEAGQMACLIPRSRTCINHVRSGWWVQDKCGETTGLEELT